MRISVDPAADKLEKTIGVNPPRGLIAQLPIERPESSAPAHELRLDIPGHWSWIGERLIKVVPHEESLAARQGPGARQLPGKQIISPARSGASLSDLQQPELPLRPGPLDIYGEAEFLLETQRETSKLPDGLQAQKTIAPATLSRQLKPFPGNEVAVRRHLAGNQRLAQAFHCLDKNEVLPAGPRGSRKRNSRSLGLAQGLYRHRGTFETDDSTLRPVGPRPLT